MIVEGRGDPFARITFWLNKMERQFSFENGLYDFDADHAQFRVFDGQAMVQAEGEARER